MVVELLQAGIRTAYRALGAQELRHETSQGSLHAFTFLGGHEHALVFLHGLGDASTTWLHAVHRLRHEFDLWLIDLPPFGLSTLEEVPYLLPREQALEVLALLEARIEHPVTLVGQSLGGWTAQWMLHEAPDRFQDAVLVAPAGAPLPGSLRALSLLRPCSPEDVLALWNAMWYTPPTLAKAGPRLLLERFHRPELRGFLAHATGREMLEPEQLSNIEVPALVVWGSQDRLLDPATPSYLATHWGAPVERSYLSRCAHLPHLERPETLFRRLRDRLHE